MFSCHKRHSRKPRQSEHKVRPSRSIYSSDKQGSEGSWIRWVSVLLCFAHGFPRSSLEQAGQLFVPGVWAGQHGFSEDLGKIQITHVHI